MIDGISVTTGKAPVEFVQNRPADAPKPEKTPQQRLEEQNVELTFDFEAVQAAVAEVQNHVQVVSGRALSFNFDPSLDRSVITVVDSETDALVRQIPSEEFLAIARVLREQTASDQQARTLRGLIFDQQT